VYAYSQLIKISSIQELKMQQRGLTDGEHFIWLLLQCSIIIMVMNGLLVIIFLKEKNNITSLKDIRFTIASRLTYSGCQLK